MITFCEDGWGLTFTNKTREAQVLLAGRTMVNLPWKKGVGMGYKTDYHLKRFKSTHLLEE